MSSKSIENFFGKIAGKVNPVMSEEYKQSSADRADFKEFQSLEQNLLEDPSQQVTAPIYRRNKDIEKQSEVLAQIFNARKEDALKRKTAPGISQTRMR